MPFSVTLKAIILFLVVNLVVNLAVNLVILPSAPHKMAIIKELGLEVTVNVNGSAAAEYKDEEPQVGNDARDRNTPTCHHYVESVDNSEFAIRVGLVPGTNTGQEWTSRSPENALLFWVAFDGGRSVAGKWVNQRSGTGQVEGVYKQANATLRKFCFAPVSTVDDDDKKRVAADMKTARNLGLIRVRVHRVVIKKSDKKQSAPQRDENFTTDGKTIAEKALKGKAVSHVAGLSAPVAVEWTKTPSYDIEYVDTSTSPLAIFYFKYRSKEALQQQLIIARPRSPSVEFHVNNQPPEETKMKGGRRRAASAKEDEDAKVPKSAFKYARIEGGKIAIDLTEDD